MIENKKLAEILSKTNQVLAKPDSEYANLIGVVTNITEPGTPEHDTDNDTIDVYVDFDADEYEQRVGRDYHEDLPNLGNTAIDQVIMSPDELYFFDVNEKPDKLFNKQYYTLYSTENGPIRMELPTPSVEDIELQNKLNALKLAGYSIQEAVSDVTEIFDITMDAANVADDLPDGTFLPDDTIYENTVSTYFVLDSNGNEVVEGSMDDVRDFIYNFS